MVAFVGALAVVVAEVVLAAVAAAEVEENAVVVGAVAAVEVEENAGAGRGRATVAAPPTGRVRGSNGIAMDARGRILIANFSLDTDNGGPLQRLDLATGAATDYI